MRPGRETSMHYFSFSDENSSDSPKSVGTRYAEHVFLHPVGYAGNLVHSRCSGHETSTHHLSYSVGTDSNTTKSTPGHVTSNLCFHIRWDLRFT
jgi:hypothetical protein